MRGGRAAWGARIERLVDRAMARGRSDRPVLDPYRGYAVPDGIVLRGRVLSSLRRTAPDPMHGRWANLRQMASLFFTDEVSGITVTLPGTDIRAVSDDEGYLTIHVPRPKDAAGWSIQPVEIEGDPGSRRDFGALVPSDAATLGVISDVDDTMMETGAYSLARNLWTTFTGSALTRRVFPDAIVLMDHLSDHGRNPVYYVSSSPWNLHAFLDRVFERAGLVTGPMFLRDLGLSGPATGAAAHGDHKGSAVDRILRANPGLPFILIGDTGQHDAEIYLEACHRHGGQIRAVVLREPGPGPDDASRAAMSAIARLGVTVTGGADFAEVARTLEQAELRLRHGR